MKHPSHNYSDYLFPWTSEHEHKESAVQGYLGSHTLAWTSYIHSLSYENMTTVPVLWPVCVSIYPIQSIHKWFVLFLFTVNQQKQRKQTCIILSYQYFGPPPTECGYCEEFSPQRSDGHIQIKTLCLLSPLTQKLSAKHASLNYKCKRGIANTNICLLFKRTLVFKDTHRLLCLLTFSLTEGPVCCVRMLPELTSPPAALSIK